MAAVTPPIFIVEAFTLGNNEAYTGNPAAVCILEYDDDISDETKQKIASTMNLSETAFVALDWSKNSSSSPVKNAKKPEPGTIRRTIRWFTPVDEVPICGHATVATTKAVLAFLNGETKSKSDSGTGTETVAIKKIEFESKFSGILPAEVSPASKFVKNPAENEDEFITLNFPINLTTGLELEPKSKPNYWLAEFARGVLGPAFSFTGSNLSAVVEDVQIVLEHSFILFRLKGRDGELPHETLAKVKPNFVKLMEPTGDEEVNIGVPHAVIVTIGAPSPKSSENDPDFYSRFFAPFYGINEDPVTGWAHTVLTPYWSQQLGADKDRVLFARQSSARGGDLRCQLQHSDHQGRGQGQNGSEISESESEDKSADDQCRVFISGRAKIVLKGVLNN